MYTDAQLRDFLYKKIKIIVAAQDIKYFLTYFETTERT